MTGSREERFPRPLYESLPWVYLVGGLAGLVGSYFLTAAPMTSFLVGVAGLALVIWGAVIWLRRRDYRDMQDRYRG
jgi:ABC-type xylose transport system permease subunit